MDNSTHKDVSVGKVSIDRVFNSEYQKEGSLTAQVRQVINRTSYYPSKQPNDSLTNNLFDSQDFGYEEQKFESEENRVAFILVPLGQTEETVQKAIDDRIKMVAEIKKSMFTENVASQEMLKPQTKEELCKKHGIPTHAFDTLPLSDPCVYRKLSNHPILSTQQIDAIKRGLRTKAQIAANQVVRHSKGTPLEGNIITDSNGKIQYKRNVFSKFFVPDEDTRNDDLDDFYASEELLAEMGGTGDILDNVQDALVEETADTAGQDA